jgi:hypothetical protein
MEQLVKHWHVLFYFVLTHIFLLVSITLTVTNIYSACLFDFGVGRINPGTFCAALISNCSGCCGSLMLLSCAISDSTSATQSSSVIYKIHFHPGGMAEPEWTCFIRAVRDAMEADYSTAGDNTKRRDACGLLIAISSFFSLCRSPIWKSTSDVVDNCDHKSEWVHWVQACIGIAMQWVTLQKSLLVFLLHFARVV